MRTFEDLREAAPAGPTYLTIGNFDGLHRGHQALLAQMRALAEADPRGAQTGSAQTALLTFDPHPLAVLRPDRPPLLLTTPWERIALAALYGVDLGIMQPFTAETAGLSAREFVTLLRQHLGLAALVVGPDFALGRQRSGDIPALRVLGEELGFAVYVVEPVEWAGTPARSSVIRDLLRDGDARAAADLLGRHYSVTGEVRHGDRRGRQIGVPTANIVPETSKILPADGVYATVAHVCSPHWAYSFPSVTNVGVRPTVDGLHHRVEAHLLNFPPPELPDNLYGQTITLEFVERLRGEQRFSGLDALVAQIQKDIERARAIFTQDPPRALRTQMVSP